MLKHLTVPDLKNARLVSYFWNSECLNEWRSTATLVVTTTERKLQETVDSPGIHWGTLLDIYKEEVASQGQQEEAEPFLNLTEKPYSRYSLKQWDFGKMVVQQVELFIKYFGEGILHLELDECRGLQYTHISFMCSNTPNLQSLALTNCVWSSTMFSATGWDTGHQFNITILKIRIPAPRTNPDIVNDIPIRYLMQQFPSLKVFKIMMDGDTDKLSATLKRFLECILKFRKDDKKLFAIKHLDLAELWHRQDNYEAPVFGKPHMELVEQCQLPLESLRVNLGTGRAVSLARITKNHHRTLKSLWVHRSEKNPPCLSLQLQTPYFELLKELRLYGIFTENFNFLISLKSLECLHVYLKSPYNAIIYKYRRISCRGRCSCKYSHYKVTAASAKMDTLVLPRLEEIHGDFVVRDQVSFKRLTTWMPNIKRAKLLFMTRENLEVALAAWRSTLDDLQVEHGSDILCMRLVKELAFSKKK